jgi:hypothetical protein
MKRYASILAGLLLAFMGAAPARAAGFDDAHRFVFYAVLEGCYEDGLSSNDVAQILMKRGDDFYMFLAREGEDLRFAGGSQRRAAAP